MKIIAVYPGRFQPFHKGHASVYKWLKNEFGNAHIATSNKVEPPKSPFDFDQKKTMMALAGVSASDINQVRNPYIASEILSKYDGKKTVLLFAVSQKDMDEDPRFSFKPTKSGKPSYLQPYKKGAKLEPFGDPEQPRGYVVVTPTFTFDVLGEPMKSATEVRKQFAEADDMTQKKIIKDLFGKYDPKVHKMMNDKIKSAAKDAPKKPKTIKQIKEQRIDTPETEHNAIKSVDRKTFDPMLKKFTEFTSKKLKLKNPPQIDLDGSDATDSFGGYNPSTMQIVVKTKHRHPMDIFRTVAHELAHHKQNERGKLGKNIAKEGATGSKIENEANAEAGKVMRWFAKANPEVFKSGYVTEGLNDPAKMKAIFLAGGPGSGKDYVMKQTLDGLGLTEINSDVAFEYLMKKNGLDLEMPKEEEAERNILRGKAKVTTTEKQRLALAGRRGVIINGTADDVEKIKRIKKTLEDDGYETMMVFVDTADEVSRQRNVERGKSGNRKVPDGTDKQGRPDSSKDIRTEKWKAAQESKKDFEKIFGKEGFVIVDNSADLRTAPKEVKDKVLAQFQSVYSKARKFTQTASRNPNADQWTQSEIQKRNVSSYVQPRASSVAQQSQQQQALSTPRAGIDRPSADELSQARRMGLSYYGFGRYGRSQNGRHVVTHTMQNGQLTAFKGTNKMVAEDKDPCWKGYRQYGMKKKGAKKVPNCVPVDEAFEDFMSEEDRANTYKREEGTDSLRKIYTKDTPGQKIKKKMKEDAAPALGYEFGGNGVGPTFSVVRSPTGSTMGASLPMAESVERWMNDEKTITRFIEKYGESAEQRLYEAAHQLNQIQFDTPQAKTITKLREAWEAKGGRDMGTVASQGKEELNERGADSKGLYRSTESGAGLTRKGAKKFGIKTAVTTPPSKLDPDGKASKRRKSFCARMGGMKGPMKDEKGRPTRKAMSLRRWNCEE